MSLDQSIDNALKEVLRQCVTAWGNGGFDIRKAAKIIKRHLRFLERKAAKK